MTHWVPGTGLHSFKHQEMKHSFSNSTSQDKESQLFLIVKWVHSLCMLLVWIGSETFHHLGEERRATFPARILAMVPKCFTVLLMPHQLPTFV